MSLSNDFKKWVMPSLLLLVASMMLILLFYLKWYYLVIIPIALMLISLDMNDRYLHPENENTKESFRYQMKLWSKIGGVILLAVLGIVIISGIFLKLL